MFLGDQDQGASFIPEIRVVEVFALIPLTQSLKNQAKNSLLYDKDILKRLMELLKVDVDD
jgi:hypothetical protein